MKNNNMKKVIFIHGYTSSPKKKKYQIISQELDRLGIEYSVPVFPGGENPSHQEWLEIVDKEVKSSTRPVVLVGHSLGTRAALLYLDEFTTKVDAVILIAAFNDDIENNKKRKDGNYSNFFEYHLDLEKIKKLANRFIVVHAKDDESIDYQQGVDISEKLGAELITYEDKGHLGGEGTAEENARIFLETIKLAI